MRLSLRAVPALLLAVSLAVGLCAGPAAAKSRIKDIVEFEGVRGNHLVGYSLVVGLAGTGDALRNAPFTQQSLQSALERLGVNTRAATPNTKDVAAVMVTAELPPFSAPGSKIDVTVSAIGDAKSLLGGTLVMAPLSGPDGQVYAVAQGTVQTGSVSASGASGSTVSKGVPTAGRIAGGASVELDTTFQLVSMSVLRLTLRNPDFTTAQRIAEVINARFPGCAQMQNPTIVAIRPPAGENMVSFVSQVENLSVEPDSPAKVVIDEVAGVIVMGENVRVSTVAIQQGNLTITVRESSQVSQPTAFSKGGTTAIVPQSDISVDEEKGKKFITLKNGASLSSMVSGLNALGVTPRDMISILQSIKTAGALQAEIQVQ
ncbi:flagellar basal body P-ring protein FlgI [Phenylobacterium sp.]|jgi:flagellar P-ring protein precursor FlgI|uniref:flagellar basal body P-ring protein FlgI n=1 Tax=Phenylobacterium sp. TaxID=1871053 RepID=UPI002E36151C|nr:flagellar basal body P-ring protein FlgI [Phenylobacterium sp.]HEX3364530.1 flagellar basal body P-ring protein FlgI [Phenylobacterium sp.]